ncbi:hypothetical protein MUK42_05332 [Musa troglodytarum]|uniref:Uncharacterized protein n=1 Tax=Musa troglodytarum TaxID=320322 RepID=A0A9E7GKY0_9LILI|nr:hypothetical protein MUK42_05332 [Musa troglodytarum]
MSVRIIKERQKNDAVEQSSICCLAMILLGEAGTVVDAIHTKQDIDSSEVDRSLADNKMSCLPTPLQIFCDMKIYDNTYSNVKY